jgi:acyl-CoA thioester hydrolase
MGSTQLEARGAYPAANANFQDGAATAAVLDAARISAPGGPWISRQGASSSLPWPLKLSIESDRDIRGAMSDDGLGLWPVKLEVPVAWGDMDAFQHVNNTVYLRWFETARIAYFEKTGMLERMKREQVGPILGRATIDFRIPVTYPDTIQVESTVVKLGRTSFVMGYRVRSHESADVIAAEGDGVIVMYDYRTAKKIEIDDVLRKRIMELEATGSR